MVFKSVRIDQKKLKNKYYVISFSPLSHLRIFTVLSHLVRFQVGKHSYVNSYFWFYWLLGSALQLLSQFCSNYRKISCKSALCVTVHRPPQWWATEVGCDLYCHQSGMGRTDWQGRGWGWGSWQGGGWVETLQQKFLKHLKLVKHKDQLPSKLILKWMLLDQSPCPWEFTAATLSW